MDSLIHCCSIIDESADREITGEFLSSLELEFSTWEDKEKKLVCHTVYCRDAAEALATAEKIKTESAEWEKNGMKIKDVSTIDIKNTDWNEFWKQHFRLIKVKNKLVIKPSWIDYEAGKGEIVIELDPGMSFGTGHHPTTMFCLKSLVSISTEQPDKMSFLDCGCGSGILSISAAKLGFSPVDAFDFDPDAVKAARENIERNTGAEDIRINVFQADLADITEIGPYDIVAANILSGVLEKNSLKLTSLVRNGAFLILAGILEEDYNSLRKTFSSRGFREISSVCENEWKSGLFRKSWTA